MVLQFYYTDHNDEEAVAVLCLNNMLKIDIEKDDLTDGYILYAYYSKHERYVYNVSKEQYELVLSIINVLK